MPGAMALQIYVRTFDKSITLNDVEATDTIPILKSRIQKKEGIPGRQQRLFMKTVHWYEEMEEAADLVVEAVAVVVAQGVLVQYHQ